MILEDIKLNMGAKEKRVLECVSEKGATNWLTAMPIKDKGFYSD